MLLPPSEVSASARTGHCSDALSGKRCLSAIICPDSLRFARTSLHLCSRICTMPTLFFFHCGISSWVLYSPLLFSYNTTRSRSRDNCGQNCPGCHWITSGLLLCLTGRKALPENCIFQNLSELHSRAERRGYTTLPPATLPGAATAAGLGHPWQQGCNFFSPPQFGSIYFLNFIVCYSQLYSSDSAPTFIRVQRFSWMDEFAQEQLPFKGEEDTSNLAAWKTNWILPERKLANAQHSPILPLHSFRSNFAFNCHQQIQILNSF